MAPMGFGMRRWHGERVAIELPAPGTSYLKAMELLGTASRLIVEEWRERTRRDAEPREWLQTVSYELIAGFIGAGFGSLFEERIRKFNRKLFSVSDDKIFQRGLAAIFADNKGLLTERDRDHFGRRLWYAYRHYVPPVFLIGFLRTAASETMEMHLAEGSIDPDFDIWITLERERDKAPQTRGDYPAAIEANVQGVRNLRSALEQRFGD